MQNKLDEKLSYYNSRNYFVKQPFVESMYQLSMFNPEGINYNNWIKFRKSTIEQIKYIKPEGLYLLLGLLSHPHTINKESLQTSLTMINKHVEIKDMTYLKLCLKLLQEYGFIIMNGFDDKMNQQTIFSIYILYNSDEVYGVHDRDYWKPIPTDYINKCLLTLDPIDVCIIFSLIINQNFYIPKDRKDESGKDVYYFCYTSYAYPELETMGRCFVSSRQNIRNHIVKLSKQGMLSYMFNGNKTYNSEGELFNPNYQYRVKLLCRMEYIHMLFKIGEMYDYRDKDIKAKIQNNFDAALRSSELQDWCRPHDYINVNFHDHMTNLSNVINGKDIITYEQLITNKPQLIFDFENKDLKPAKKKIESDINMDKILTLKQYHDSLKSKNLINNFDIVPNPFNNTTTEERSVF